MAQHQATTMAERARKAQIMEMLQDMDYPYDVALELVWQYMDDDNFADLFARWINDGEEETP